MSNSHFIQVNTMSKSISNAILMFVLLTNTITMTDEIPQHFHEHLQQQHCFCEQLHKNMEYHGLKIKGRNIKDFED